MAHSDPATLRAEFYSLPEHARVDRATAAAAAFLSPATLEAAAIRGGGPPYTRIGRKALYVKADVLSWLDGRRVENTAQLSESSEA